MKICYNALVCLLLVSSFTTNINAAPSRQTQSVFIKKLKKAWQNNWIKAGTVTAACALLYALGIKCDIFTACTGAVDCKKCLTTETKIVDSSNKLLWKAVVLLSGLATCACGYAYFNSQADESVESSVASHENSSDELSLDDSFFDFNDEQLAELQEALPAPSANVVEAEQVTIVPEVVENNFTSITAESDPIVIEVTENLGDEEQVNVSSDEYSVDFIEDEIEELQDETVLPEAKFVESFLTTTQE